MSAPGLSWDAMLKITKIGLELIPDSDMYIFFEKGTRAEISYISNRYRKADNKYVKSHDPKEESNHIIYLDVKYEMSKLLATSGFKWMDPKKFELNKYTSNN